MLASQHGEMDPSQQRIFFKCECFICLSLAQYGVQQFQRFTARPFLCLLPLNTSKKKLLMLLQFWDYPELINRMLILLGCQSLAYTGIWGYSAAIFCLFFGVLSIVWHFWTWSDDVPKKAFNPSSEVLHGLPVFCVIQFSILLLSASSLPLLPQLPCMNAYLMIEHQ